ncbi:hypothetical protein PSPO01_14569 [Paraphaeosphaeria sporulosa]
MDFENSKDRPEFADEAGRDAGSISGPSNISRPGTPSSVLGGSERGCPASKGSDRDERNAGVTYPTRYHTTPSKMRKYSPSPNSCAAGLGSPT